MPGPQRIVVEREKPRQRSRAPKGYFGKAYDTITSSENQSIVRSVAVFGTAVAFLASPWAELLLPPSQMRKKK
ncbi:hypothetical protein F4778DRAFT_787110 [Xylariomycetidae sp. FL2044]|nr:hypothetical protein F4778DRAFT_787110 [Xylariomycetidae sp. FL2044]